MITNREINSEALLEEALDEVVVSARANDVDDEVVLEALRERAAVIEAGEELAATVPERPDDSEE